MELDYDALGFKAGIEIHQELDTKKLFCGCSTGMSEKTPSTKIKRKLRAVSGEQGDTDAASLYEQLRGREFIYQGYDEECCLVELDEEPPRPVNSEAFGIALSVAKLFGMRVPDAVCTMRKTVTDGSATSGFQRTMLIGLAGKNSKMKTSFGDVGIVQLNLEEDSSRIEKKEDSKVYYSLSRLGVPLLEIGTDASLKTPEHVREAALEIGTILRSFKVKRGIGTIRQDVNVSIKGGARIEVKGWQDIKKLEELVRNEVLRQYNLLQIKKELQHRGLSRFKKQSMDATSLFTGCESKIISEIISSGGKVHAILLPKFSGLLKKDVCPGKTFGRELSEYAKAYGTKGMIHTDEDLAKYRLEKEFSQLKKMLSADQEDLIIIVGGKEQVAANAIDAIYERANYCLVGVPEETRIPNHDNATSSYARPLPGAHRLYPETDIPNMNITKKMLDETRLPELLPSKISRYVKQYSITEDAAKEIIREGYDLDAYSKEFKSIEPKLIYHVLIESPKEVKKRTGKEVDISQYAHELLTLLDKQEISRDAVFEILSSAAEGKALDYSRYKSLSPGVLGSMIKEIIDQNKGLPENAVIGRVMEKLRGKADGKMIVDITKKLLR